MQKITVLLFFLFPFYSLTAQDTINSANDLDDLWSTYFNTGDLSAITEITSVFEWKDQFRQEIDDFLSDETHDRSKLIELLTEFGFKLNKDQNKLSEQGSVGAMTILILEDDRSRSMFQEISSIIHSKESTLNQMMILGAATWSLKSNSKQYHEVKKHLLAIYDGLNSTTKYMIDNIIIPLPLNVNSSKEDFSLFGSYEVINACRIKTDGTQLLIPTMNGEFTFKGDDYRLKVDINDDHQFTDNEIVSNQKMNYELYDNAYYIFLDQIKTYKIELIDDERRIFFKLYLLQSVEELDPGINDQFLLLKKVNEE